MPDEHEPAPISPPERPESPEPRGAEPSMADAVRGLNRAWVGTLTQPQVSERPIAFGYVGLDGVSLRTRIECSVKPDHLTERSVLFRPALRPREAATLSLTISPLRQEVEPQAGATFVTSSATGAPKWLFSTLPPGFACHLPPDGPFDG